MSECSGSIDCVKRVKLILNEEEEELEEAGLTGSMADKHTSTGMEMRRCRETEASLCLSLWRLK